MDFWLFLVVVILGVTLIQAVQDVLRRRAITSKELEALRQDIATIRKDLEEIKESLADLIIQQADRVP